ncbi:hypothetical protein D3C87_716100 [compost metagenome]
MAAILTVAVLLSKMLMFAGVLFTLTNGLFEVPKVTTTVSVPSTMASANTGIVMVAVVAPAGMVMVLTTGE